MPGLGVLGWQLNSIGVSGGEGVRIYVQEPKCPILHGEGHIRSATAEGILIGDWLGSRMLWKPCYSEDPRRLHPILSLTIDTQAGGGILVGLGPCWREGGFARALCVLLGRGPLHHIAKELPVAFGPPNLPGLCGPE